MRLWTRFGMLVGGLLMLVGAFMPWIGTLRPFQVPIGFLLGQGDRIAVVVQPPGIDGTFVHSMGAVLIVTGLASTLVGLFGGRRVGQVAAGLTGVVVAVFAAQVVYGTGELPDQAYGMVIGELAAALLMVAAFWPPARDPDGIAPAGRHPVRDDIERAHRRLVTH